MKILIINDYAYIEGGAGKVAISSAIGLADKGHEVVYFSAVGPMSDELKKSNIKKIICLDQKDILTNKNKIYAMLSGIRNIAAINKLKELLSKWNPDISHIHGVSKALSWAVIDYIFKRQIPVIYSLHDFGLLCPNMGLYDFKNCRQCSLYKSKTYFKCLVTDCDKRSYTQKLWRWIRFFYTRNFIRVRRKISGYIAVSFFIADFFKKYLNPGSRIKVIYNPIEPIDENDFKQKIYVKDFNDNLTTFLFVGRLSTEKGIDLLLKAITEVDARLIIIGDGELFDDCLRMSDSLEKNKVTVYKWQSEEKKIEFILNSDMLVLPSLVMETAGIALLEAKKYGTAAIVSDIGAFKEFIKDNEDGLFFQAGSKDSLINAMNKIIKNPGLAAELGNNARINFKNYNGSINEHTECLLRFYNEVIGFK